MRQGKKRFWFEYERGGVRAVAFTAELVYNVICCSVLWFMARSLGVHLNPWVFFPFYVVAFNAVSLMRVRDRNRGGSSAP